MSTTNTLMIPALQTATATINIKALPPQHAWSGNVQITQGFQVLRVRANAACRVRLYNTKQSQMTDMQRPTTKVPAQGDGVILDFVMLLPGERKVVDCVAESQDGTVYATVTNCSTTQRDFTVALTYADLGDF